MLSLTLKGETITTITPSEREERKEGERRDFLRKVIQPQKTHFADMELKLQARAVLGWGEARQGPGTDQWNEGLQLGILFLQCPTLAKPKRKASG